MSRHLSSRQIFGCLIDAVHPSERWHARQCAACRAEIEALATPLALFRASIHHWSERQAGSALETAPAFPPASESFNRAWYSAGAYSVFVHCAAAALLLALGSVTPMQRLVRE